MVTFNLKERERCNVQVSIIDSSHFIIHTIRLLCHYEVIKKCLRETKREYSVRKTLVSSLPTSSGIRSLVVQNLLTKKSIFPQVSVDY